MQPLFRFAAILAALALAPTVAAAGTVYKWTDDDGLTHYTQQPPLGRAAERLEPHGSSGPPRRVGPAPAQSAAMEDESAQESDAPGSVAEYCTQMREQAETLASDQPLSVRQEGGELQALEGEDRAERLERTREQIAANCSDEAG